MKILEDQGFKGSKEASSLSRPFLQGWGTFPGWGAHRRNPVKVSVWRLNNRCRLHSTSKGMEMIAFVEGPFHVLATMLKLLEIVTHVILPTL